MRDERLFEPTDEDRAGHVRRLLEANAEAALQKLTRAKSRMDAAQAEFEAANAVLLDFLAVANITPDTTGAVFDSPTISKDIKAMDAERMVDAVLDGSTAKMHWAGQTLYSLTAASELALALTVNKARPMGDACKDARVIGAEYAKRTRSSFQGVVVEGDVITITLRRLCATCATSTDEASDDFCASAGSDDPACGDWR